MHGDIRFEASAAPVSQESADLQRRLEARQRRLLDEEEAREAQGQERAESHVRHARVKRRVNALFLIIFGAGAALYSSGIRTSVTLSLSVLAIFLVPAAVYGLTHYSVILKRWQAGKTIKVPKSRLYW
ncbi:hypothetical protein ACFV27_35635 [Streptomyces antimycoticus]|uniref:hypothetical protein n=1 Tax=Streptomyces antimycoticus TaxID=68175 RepID=UPI002570EBA2|nr:hypothetical protein [Streptomyces antimycoticus]WJD96113.1 hypothetical protein QR300_08935 [Streptomyces antimycoticus]